MASFIQFGKNRRASTTSVYMQLLSTLASDLDHMLSELCTTPPPPYDRLDSDNELINRQTSVGVGSNGVDLSHGGTLLNTDRHRLDGTAFASKDFHHHGPLTTGGQLDYTHKPTGSVLSAVGSNTRGFGSDVGARGTYNIYNSANGRTSAGVSAEYSRHFGGPQGNSRPNYGAFAHFTHRF